MSCRRLAMVMAHGSHKTPLTRVNGLEEAVETDGLGDEDELEMVVLLKGGGTRVIRLLEGKTTLSPDPEWYAYLFRKIAGQQPKATTVEVLLSA